MTEPTESQDTELPVRSNGSFRMHGSPAQVSKLLFNLGKARSEMDPVIADANGQFQNRGFKYADISSIYRSAIPALAKHGIMVFHPNCQVDQETQRAVTIVAGHEALIEVSHDFSGSIAAETIKGFGSLLTYLNRYQVRGLVAVAGDDDPDQDGSAGTKPFQRTPPSPPAKPEARREPPPKEPAPARTRAPEPAPQPAPVAPITKAEPDPEKRPASVPPPSSVGPAEENFIPDHIQLAKASQTAIALSDALKAAGFEGKEEQVILFAKVVGRPITDSPVTFGEARKLLGYLDGK
jgi:hypothetical protein